MPISALLGISRRCSVAAMDRSSAHNTARRSGAKGGPPTMTAMRWRIQLWRSSNYFLVITKRRDAGFIMPLNTSTPIEFGRGYFSGSYAFAGDYEAALSHLEDAIRLSPRAGSVVVWHVCKGWAALLRRAIPGGGEFTELAQRSRSRISRHLRGLGFCVPDISGDTVAARAAWISCCIAVPGLAASDERLVRPFAQSAEQERFMEGLRKAGLPEV